MSDWHGTFHRLHLKVRAAGSTVLSYASTAMAGLAEHQLSVHVADSGLMMKKALKR